MNPIAVSPLMMLCLFTLPFQGNGDQLGCIELEMENAALKQLLEDRPASLQKRDVGASERILVSRAAHQLAEERVGREVRGTESVSDLQGWSSDLSALRTYFEEQRKRHNGHPLVIEKLEAFLQGIAAQEYKIGKYLSVYKEALYSSVISPYTNVKASDLESIQDVIMRLQEFNSSIPFFQEVVSSVASTRAVTVLCKRAREQFKVNKHQVIKELSRVQAGDAELAKLKTFRTKTQEAIGSLRDSMAYAGIVRSSELEDMEETVGIIDSATTTIKLLVKSVKVLQSALSELGGEASQTTEELINAISSLNLAEDDQEYPSEVGMISAQDEEKYCINSTLVLKKTDGDLISINGETPIKAVGYETHTESYIYDHVYDCAYRKRMRVERGQRSRRHTRRPMIPLDHLISRADDEIKLHIRRLKDDVATTIGTVAEWQRWRSGWHSCRVRCGPLHGWERGYNGTSLHFKLVCPRQTP